METVSPVTAVLFDYGGVIAEEGFKAGMRAIAEKNSLEPDTLIRTAFETVYDLGFTSGRIREEGFWDVLRRKTGIRGADADLKEEILSRFILRPWMLDVVSDLKQRGLFVAILSDQTHWLDELDERHPFFHYFHRVFNSYHAGITKKDPVWFDQVLCQIDKRAEEVLFIDDHRSNLKRAEDRGLQTLYYTDKENFLHRLRHYLPWDAEQ